ncbi:hypothetical protein SDC9_166359 [bioreactor metagenome]|uniref:Uncharacterized protein n=1 Tax=bioreactor metagenome TaxID=1076179 RepID=A0A645G4P4_9ZZZZ
MGQTRTGLKFYLGNFIVLNQSNKLGIADLHRGAALRTRDPVAHVADDNRQQQSPAHQGNNAAPIVASVLPLPVGTLAILLVVILTHPTNTPLPDKRLCLNYHAVYHKKRRATRTAILFSVKFL